MADQIKNAIRNTIRSVRAKLSPPFKTTASKQICTRIYSLELYKNAKRIALYQAANGEVDLRSIWENACSQGKLCYFPVTKDDKTLAFLPVEQNTAFKKNKYGIYEPEVSMDLAIDPDELDLIFLPLVAFDIRCIRIGMGVGYYDRSLQHKENCSLLGVAYQFQRVDFIQPEPWDVPLDAVVTNRAVYWREAQF